MGGLGENAAEMYTGSCWNFTKPTTAPTFRELPLREKRCPEVNERIDRKAEPASVYDLSMGNA
ncbi:MAG TPA: hypothetical protein DEB39_08350 [Planctomycetaceae bacterium]|nr:hypothetical protein [Planctomycetaceae bacterium]